MSTQAKNPAVANPELTSGVNAKAMLKDLAKENRKIKLGKRTELEIIKATKFYKKGQVINPHSTYAEKLIKEKIAKAVN